MTIPRFEDFMREREAAARAFASGDVAPLDALVTSDSPATFFGPKGGHVQGADEVAAVYARDAARFAGGETRFEILHMGADGEVGYWVGYQRALVRLHGHHGPVRFDLRVTELFRLEDGRWR